MRKLLILFFIHSFCISIFSQSNIDLFIENANVTGSNFSFEVHATRTAGWPLGNNSLGSASYYFNINASALNTPILSFINANISIHGNTLAFNDVGGTLFLRITSTIGGAGGVLTQGTKYHLYTVELNIISGKENENSNLSWSTNNTGLTNGLNQSLVESYNSSGNIPLPVELKSFQVNSVEGTKAQLNWVTATEVNNHGFEIERTIAGSQKSKVKSQNEELDWKNVAFVKGHGNSNSTKTYTYTDKNLLGGSKFMYRLKQIDIDGTFEYSDIVEVEVLPSQYELFQNYPNPFNPETNIKFSLPEDAKIAINIYNVLGEKVAKILNKELKAGFHQVNFNITSAGYKLSSGVYLYTIETKNFSKVKKMILMK